MSAKDFIALADAMRNVRNLSEEVIAALCKFCRGQNPRFNEDRWRSYLNGECGPRGGPLKNPNEKK